MLKPDNTKRIEKFRKDAMLLQSKYSQKEIAEKLDIDNANFNSYYNGHKKPGKNFLNKFDRFFSEEIKGLEFKYLEHDNPVLMVEESTSDYYPYRNQDDYITTLKEQNKILQEIIENNQRLIETNLSVLLATIKSVHAHQAAEERFIRQSLNKLTDRSKRSHTGKSDPAKPEIAIRKKKPAKRK